MLMHRGFAIAGFVRRTLAACATSALIASTALTPLASAFAQNASPAPQAGAQGDTAKPWPGPPITAQNSAGDPPARVGRIARMNGTVSFHTADEDQWGPATLNYPLTSGNALWTEPDSRAELQIGSGNRLVMDSRTELNVIALDDSRFEAGLPQGTAYLNVADVAPGESYTLQTPRGSVEIAEPGRYVIAAGDDNTPTSVTALDGGKAQLRGRGLNQSVSAGQRAALSGPIDGDEPVKADLGPAAQRTAFVQSVMAEEKTGPQTTATPAVVQNTPAARPAAPRAVTPPASMPAQVQGMTGAQDLTSYGSWSTAPDYGAVWYPPVEVGWVPYRHGHWAYIPPWGWTWVADEPWGFAPFHYGRWVMVRDRWAWSPGVVVRAHHYPYHRPVYAPALVAFFGTGSGISISITAGNVGWVPLGWHEPYYPPYRVSRTYIRNVNVTHVTNITKVTNVTNVNNATVSRYVNRNGATVVSADAMRRSQPVQRAVQQTDRRQVEAARVDRRARIEPTVTTAGMSPKAAERMGMTGAESRSSQHRPAPGPQIRQSERRATDLKPVEARQAAPQLRDQRQTQPREIRNQPGDAHRQVDQGQRPEISQPMQPKQQQSRQDQQHGIERRQDVPGTVERQRQDLQRQEYRRQQQETQQRQVQERQMQERQNQERQRQQHDDMQRQTQERQRQEQQRQIMQRQQETQRQHMEQQRQMQYQQQRQQETQQQQTRQQEVRRQQQEVDEQRRQRREAN